MIADYYNNFHLYINVHPHFKDVQKYISQNNPLDISTGKYDVNNYGAFLLVQEYPTKNISDGFIECHKKYIDIQYSVKGSEIIGVCNKKNCIEEPYDEEKDLQKLQGNTDILTLLPDHFMIFFPDDGHMPGLMLGNKKDMIKKLVFKIPVIIT